MRMTLVGEGENLGVLVDRLPDAVDATDDELGEFDRRFASLAGVLTRRQYEAVRAAAELGYYGMPPPSTTASRRERGRPSKTATERI